VSGGYGTGVSTDAASDFDVAPEGDASPRSGIAPWAETPSVIETLPEADETPYVVESVRGEIAVAEEGAARLAGLASSSGLRLPEGPVVFPALPLMPGDAAEPGLPGLGGLPGVPDPAGWPAPGGQDGPGGPGAGVHGFDVQGSAVGAAERGVTPVTHGHEDARGREGVRGHRAHGVGPYAGSYAVVPSTSHASSSRTPARDADAPLWPAGRNAVPANGAAGDNGSARHGDAQAVTSDQGAPLWLVVGAVVGAEVPGTRDRQRDIPVFPG
jgi:hypothetical protein